MIRAFTPAATAGAAGARTGDAAARRWGRRGDRQKRGWFCLGTLIMLIEPMTGTRVLKRSFRQDDASGGVDAGGGVVRKDARAIAATNEWHASKAEIFNSVLLVLLEDVNALIIEIWFLALEGDEVVSSIFFLTAAGTLMHMVLNFSRLKFREI